MSNIELLAELNAFRAAEGKDALKDWRNARHMPMLEVYRHNKKFNEIMSRSKPDDEFEASQAELAAQTVRPVAEAEEEVSTTESAEGFTNETDGDFAGNKAVQEKAAELAKSKTYKQIANYDKSAIEKPVAFIHQFLSDNPGMTRKEAVIALTEGYGINYSTARTQYQRWFAKQGKGA